MEDQDQLPVIHEEDEDNDKNPLHQSGVSVDLASSLNKDNERPDDIIEESSRRSLSVVGHSLQNRNSDIDNDY